MNRDKQNSLIPSAYKCSEQDEFDDYETSDDADDYSYEIYQSRRRRKYDDADTTNGNDVQQLTDGNGVQQLTDGNDGQQTTYDKLSTEADDKRVITEVYKPTTDTWITGPLLQEGFHFTGLIKYMGKMCALGLLGK